MADKSLKATCHCGAISTTVPRVPELINECQCTLCRRYGVAWGYYKVDEAKFDIKEGAKIGKYVWGDKTKSFDFCGNCGCMFRWWPFELKDPDGSTAEFGLNTRLINPMQLLHVDRKIENSWLFAPIDNPDAAHEDDKANY